MESKQYQEFYSKKTFRAKAKPFYEQERFISYKKHRKLYDEAMTELNEARADVNITEEERDNKIIKLLTEMHLESAFIMLATIRMNRITTYINIITSLGLAINIAKALFDNNYVVLVVSIAILILVFIHNLKMSNDISTQKQRFIKHMDIDKI